MQKNLIRITAALLLLVESYYFFGILKQDSFVFKSLKMDISNKMYTDKVMNGIPYYEPAEKVAVGVLNFQNSNNSIDCLLLESYANQLLNMSERSSQGYYILAACSEFKNQPDETFKMINLALKYDPLNTAYRVARVAYFINVSDLDRAQREVDIIQGIDPGTEQFSYVKDLLQQKKNMQQKANDIKVQK